MGSKRYFLDQDSSCHWYLIDADRADDWDVWVNLDEDDEAGWEAPDYAKRLNGYPSSITFENPQEFECEI